MQDKGCGKPRSRSKADNKEFTHQCIDCGKNYQTFSGVQYHYKSDSNSCTGIECSICGVDHFTTKKGLKQHKATEHDKNGSYYPKLEDEQWFREKYIEEGYNTTEIAELVGCSKAQARSWKNKHNIESKTEYMSRGIGRNNPNSNRESVECFSCGVMFDRPESAIRNDQKQFCGTECFHDWLASRRGKEHPLYKPNAPYQYGPNWQEQRKKALKRDDYTCQGCGLLQCDHYRELNVHHIIPREEFVDESDSYDYKKGNKLSNLVSLCDSCHQKWEGIPVRPMIHERE